MLVIDVEGFPSSHFAVEPRPFINGALENKQEEGKKTLFSNVDQFPLADEIPGRVRIDFLRQEGQIPSATLLAGYPRAVFCCFLGCFYRSFFSACSSCPVYGT